MQSVDHHSHPPDPHFTGHLRNRPLTTHSLPLMIVRSGGSPFQPSDEDNDDTGNDVDIDSNFNGDSRCDERLSVTIATRTPSAKKATATTSSAATQRSKNALLCTSHIVDSKCNAAVVSSKPTGDVDDIKTSRYMYEPHVVVQRRDDNNRIYTVLVPVGKAIPIVEATSSRQTPAVAAIANVPDTNSTNNRRRRIGLVIPPSLDATGHVTCSSVESNAFFPAASPRSHADSGRLFDSLPVSGDMLTVRPSLADRPSTVSRSVSVDKVRTNQSATVMAVVPDGGGVGLDLEVTRLIASVDSLHIPSSRRSKSALTPRLKSKRTMQTIMTDLNRVF